jgi:hypothetical protein
MAGSRARIAGAAVGLVIAAAGCDTLLGLGQFKNVACAIDCPDVSTQETSGPEASVPEASGPDVVDSGDGGDSSDASAVADAVFFPDAIDEFAPPEAASPHEVWAHWAMPNPDASIGPDSPVLLPNPMAYDASADGRVLDMVTLLTWESSSFATTDYAGAWRHCDTIGMRVPTRIDLVSLIDFTTSPTINGAVFPGTTGANYWTSSVVWTDAGPDAALQFWSVSFDDGLVAPAAATFVRCVAGATQ